MDIVRSLARARRVQVVVVATIVLVAIIIFRPGAKYQVIDGFPIGSAAPCGACTDEIAMATTALDARDPGHAPVLSATPYTDIDPCTNGMSDVLCSRDAHVYVVVFRFADGSTRATGVACLGVSPCRGTESYPFALP
jgi:hypothetical protein